MTFSAACRLAAFVAASTVAASGQLAICDGNGSAHLSTTAMALGHPATLSLDGAPGGLFFLGIGDALGFTDYAGIGLSCVELGSLSAIIGGVIPPTGRFDLVAVIPAIPFWQNAVLFTQAVVIDSAAPGGVGLSNMRRLDFELADSFVALPALIVGRGYAASAPLPTGQVFFCGGGREDINTQGGSFFPNMGFLDAGDNATTELYHPIARLFGPGPSMSTMRVGHTATPLPDGRVLIVGGVDGARQALSTCEIYDPLNNSIVSASPMASPRAGHVAFALPNGDVLVAGGASGGFAAAQSYVSVPPNALPTGEVYHPASNLWTPVSNVMQAPRYRPAGAVAPNGLPLIVSGCDAVQLIVFGFGVATLPHDTPSCDYYDPALNAFVAAPPINGPAMRGATAITTTAGKTLVFGGLFTMPSGLQSVGYYNVFDGTSWSFGPPMFVGFDPAAVALANGEVLAVKCRNPSAVAPPVAFRTDGVVATPAAAPILGVTAGARLVAIDDGSFVLCGGESFSIGSSPTPRYATLYMPIP
jgi:hypothetical protein